MSQPLLKLMPSRRWLPALAAWADSPSAVQTAQWLVRFYYFALLYFSIGLFRRWLPSLEPLEGLVAYAPLWPVAWVQFVSIPTAITIVRGLFLAGALGAALAPGSRWVRILAFVGLLEFVGLYASALLIDVDWYVWVPVAFLLIFLPSGWQRTGPDPAGRERFLWVLWGCQAFILLTYTMAGIGKLSGAAGQLAAGEAHTFSPAAPALFIANQLLYIGTATPLGPWVIGHPWLAWPFFVAGDLLQLSALAAAFRPTWQRAWGIGLILFHVGSYLVMGIGFAANVLLIALFLIASPFRRTANAVPPPAGIV